GCRTRAAWTSACGASAPLPAASDRYRGLHAAMLPDRGERASEPTDEFKPDGARRLTVESPRKRGSGDSRLCATRRVGSRGSRVLEEGGAGRTHRGGRRAGGGGGGGGRRRRGRGCRRRGRGCRRRGRGRRRRGRGCRRRG